jgi:superfamily II DNA/RNA helicase
MKEIFSAGSVVRARQRDWIVLPKQNVQEDFLRLRPLQGSQFEECLIDPDLELMPVETAEFPLPDVLNQPLGNQSTANLLKDSLLLSLRRGTGPLRCMSQISVVPRAYQIVPLLMALKQKVVRLLIGDDVGLGKTIEAGLVLKELLERGEIDSFAVICPPNLVDQWIQELHSRFHIPAVAVTSASANKLEKNSSNFNIFAENPYTVISLDFMKSDFRRTSFVQACPMFVVIDEAHTCTTGNSNAANRQSQRANHLRYELVRELADNEKRSMLLLTATPHSGNSAAYFNLLGFLDKRFLELENFDKIVGTNISDKVQKREYENILAKLSKHFVQRRRSDIVEFERGTFPKKETKAKHFSFHENYSKFFEEAVNFVESFVQSSNLEGENSHARRTYWAAVAFMQCVSSSPAAAMETIKNSMAKHDLQKQSLAAPNAENSTQQNGFAQEAMEVESAELENEELDIFVLPENYDNNETAGNSVDQLLLANVSDLEPDLMSIQDKNKKHLEKIWKVASSIKPEHDNKLQALLSELKILVGKDSFNVVVFCRYISTAKYVCENIEKSFENCFENLKIECITGELSNTERQEHISEFSLCEGIKILVATDCLSEGINLQANFNAVVHYDLSWNPNRIEQREGRVDRFGQKAEVVKMLTMLGSDNAMDMAMYNILQKKIGIIDEQIGTKMNLVQEAFGAIRSLRQMFGLKDESEEKKQSKFNEKLKIGETEKQKKSQKPSMFTEFDNKLLADRQKLIAAEKAQNLDWTEQMRKYRKTRFAQKTLAPEIVMPIFARMDKELGNAELVETFLKSACAHWNGPLKNKKMHYVLNINSLPFSLKHSFANIGYEALKNEVELEFKASTNNRVEVVSRAHPIVQTIAQYVFGNAFELQKSEFFLPRTGCWVSNKVPQRTLVGLFRMRYELKTYRQREQKSVYLEEASVITYNDSTGLFEQLSADDSLLRFDAVGNVTENAMRRQLSWGLEVFQSHKTNLKNIAHERAYEILKEHQEVREAGKEETTVGAESLQRDKVVTLGSPNLVGIFVLIPEV